VGAALLCGAAAGLLNGLVTVKGRIAPFIVTLGTMSIYRSLALYIAGAGEFRAEHEAYHEIGTGYALGLPVPALVFLALAVVFHVILNNTRYGRYVLAVGASEEVARYSAIRVNLVKCVTYVIAGVSVGVTAVLVSSRLNSISSSSDGIMYELDAIAAVVIGGTSMSGGKASIAGTMIGAIILGIINNMLVMMEVSPYLQGTVKGAVIIIAVLLQYRRRQSE
jgi:ribose transport system permease protein